MKKGLSLIILMVTIIVTIILAGAVVLIGNKNNILGSSEEMVFKNDATIFLDELEEKMISKGIRSQTTNIDNIYDSENETEYMNVMQHYIPSFSDKYKGKLVIYNGELKYMSRNVTQEEKKWCIDVGIGPYITLKIGDEIPGFSQTYYNEEKNYTPSSDKTGCNNSTISTNSNSNINLIKWYVMKIDGNNITLIGEPVDVSFYLNSNNAYLYGPEELNNICKVLYSIEDDNNNILYQARSINEEDVLYLSEYIKPNNGKTIAERYDETAGTFYPYDNNGEADWKDWKVAGDDYEYQTKNTYYGFSRSNLVSNTDEQKNKIDLLFGKNDEYTSFWIAGTCIAVNSGTVDYRMFCVEYIGGATMVNAVPLCYQSKRGSANSSYNKFGIRPVITVPYDIIEPLLSE